MATSPLNLIMPLLLCVFLFGSGGLCQSVPGLYVFGDSLVDVGNNNYIRTIAKSNFPRNGIDYPTGPTGRFTNGKNVADFLADMVELPSPPPFLSLVSDSKNLNSTNATVTGVNFASGGSGLFTGEDALINSTISLSEQVGNYSIVYDQLVQQLGFDRTQAHLAKSLFLIVVGSNDLFNYFQNDSKVAEKYTVQQYVDRMVYTLKELLTQMYWLGARKFVVSEVGVIGCVPGQRIRNSNSECNFEANYGATKYNDGLEALLNDLKLEYPDMHYSYFHTYDVMSDLIEHSETYGIVEIKIQCCRGLIIPELCLPFTPICPNRTNHLFWDAFHPTEYTYSIFARAVYNGSQDVTTPMNVEQLVNV